MLIGMQSAKRIDILGQSMCMLRIAKEHIDIVKHLCGFQIVFLMGDSVQMRHCLIHSSKFAGNVRIPYLYQRFLGQLAKAGIHPICHPRGHLKCFFITAHFIDIN
ncbi:hypothetical protein D3C81_1068800 [compost metagenome]